MFWQNARSSWFCHFHGSGRRVQESDRRLDRGGTQVHVPLRRSEILMSGELLDGPHGRATHREMRTERVAYAARGISAIMPTAGLCRQRVRRTVSTLVWTARRRL